MFRILEGTFPKLRQPFPNPPVAGPADRLSLAAFMAVVVHVLVILGVSFAPQEPGPREQRSLDVLLVQRPSPAPPEEAQFLAEAHQHGTLPSHQATAAPPAASTARVRATLEARGSSAPSTPSATHSETTTQSDSPPPAVPLAQKLVPREHRTPERRAGPMLEPETSEEPAPPDATERTATNNVAEPPVRVPSSADTRARVMEDLQAEIDQRLKEFEDRPKRKWITARTRAHAYAAYMEAWRKRVERIGNQNYPEEARRLGLSGSLSLDVALNADGTVAQIVLRRSSGERVLDDAAVRIVELAAPFAEFPPSIRNEVDILHIERTWQFSSGDRFKSR